MAECPFLSKELFGRTSLVSDRGEENTMGQSLEAPSSNLPLCNPRHLVRLLPSAVVCEGLPQWLRGEEFMCSAGVGRDANSVPGLERSPGEGCGNPLQYSSLENPQYSSLKSPMDRGAWQATAHAAAKSWTWLKWLSMHVWCMWKFPSPSPSRTPFWQRFSQEVSRNLHPGVLSPWRRIPHAACAPCCAQVLSRVRLSETPQTGPPASSVHGILQARTLEGLPIPSPGDLPEPGIQPGAPALRGGFFISWATREAPHSAYWCSK